MAETQEVKRGPGRPPKSEAKPDANMVHVTYVPQPGDPAVTTWNGHTFHANKPTPVNADVHGKMIEQARGNPWFEVAGQDKPKTPSAANSPTNSEEYRSYAIGWFKTVDSSKAMKARWAAEEEMRNELGVGTDDLEYLDKLYIPRLAELEKAEG